MPSTEWRETVAPDEDERFARHARTLREVQAASARDGRPARALHAKGLVGATAELEILGDLPAHARHGIFAAPATYRGWARFSNGAPRRQHDKKATCAGSRSSSSASTATRCSRARSSPGPRTSWR
ncbi:MAG: hypothetical protein JNL38_35080, partial [Myxococcales bacterium]|nr:hypothetical protein [Myxococcales bacterium]